MQTTLSISVTPDLAAILFWGVFVALLTLAILSAIRWVIDRQTRDLRQRVALLEQRLADLETQRNED